MFKLVNMDINNHFSSLIFSPVACANNCDTCTNALNTCDNCADGYDAEAVCTGKEQLATI